MAYFDLKGGRGFDECSLTSSISVAQVREPPDIAQSHSVPDTGEDEVKLPRPVPSLYFFTPLKVQVKLGVTTQGYLSCITSL